MSTALPPSADVIVVGAGNAAFCAALAAPEQGVSVLVLERAPEDEAGGNSRFTAGAFRCVYDGVDDLRALMPDLSDEEISKSDIGTYTEEKFFDDMGRITEYRTDPDLCEILIKRSKATMLWMRDKGVRFMPIWTNLVLWEMRCNSKICACSSEPLWRRTAELDPQLLLN